MYSHLSSIRKALRCSSLFSHLPRNLIASRCSSSVPPKYDLSSESNYSISTPPRPSKYIDFIRGSVRDHDRNKSSGGDDGIDYVHVKILRNNCFVTVTDSKGNKKFGFSNGSLPNKAGVKCGRYSAEVATEHVGRMCRSMGMKSVVMKVNGLIHFKKKKQAILGWMEGYNNSRIDQSPVICIEDNTQKPHNGCRLRKARRA